MDVEWLGLPRMHSYYTYSAIANLVLEHFANEGEAPVSLFRKIQYGLKQDAKFIEDYKSMDRKEITQELIDKFRLRIEQHRERMEML